MQFLDDSLLPENQQPLVIQVAQGAVQIVGVAGRGGGDHVPQVRHAGLSGLVVSQDTATDARMALQGEKVEQPFRGQQPYRGDRGVVGFQGAGNPGGAALALV